MQTAIDPKTEAALLNTVNNNLPNDPDHPGNIFYRSHLQVTDTFEQPPVVLSVIQDQRESVIGTLGNISTVIGKAKSRKTYFISLLAGLFLRRELLPTALQLRATLPPEKRSILYIDTEQGRFHALKVLRRIVQIAGLPPDQQPSSLHYLTLRPYAPDKRLQVIDYALHHLNNTGLVIIDGSRDMVFDINDQREATITVNSLMRWSDELQLHLINVLHQNKNDLNARGHLGTELVNKSESVISVEKDGDRSIIKSLQLRDRDFVDMAFGIDEDDKPYLIDNYQATEQVSKYNDPSDQPDSLHQNLLEYVFEKDQVFTFNKICEAIQKQAARFDITLSDHKARNWAKYYMDESFVQSEKKGQSMRITLNHVN